MALVRFIYLCNYCLSGKVIFMSMHPKSPSRSGRRTIAFSNFPKSLSVVPGQSFSTGFIWASGALVAFGLAVAVLSMIIAFVLLMAAIAAIVVPAIIKQFNGF